MVFSNGKSAIGGIIDSTGEITLNNVTFLLNNVSFISDHTKYLGGAIANHGGKINCYNSRFIDNHAESGAAIFIENGELNIQNTDITSSIQNRYGQVWARYSTVNIDNLNIINASSLYSPAISLEYCSDTRITNSRFVNLTADISAGAIGVKRSGNLYIKNCDFINTKSSKNAGAVIVDYIDDVSNVIVLDSRFYNSSSLIGGAYVQLGGYLSMNNTEFINNSAALNGGALYLSYVTGELNNCTFDSNSVEGSEGFTGLGGAVYLDYDSLYIIASKFINNSAIAGNAIFLYDSSYVISNNTFINNKNAVYSFIDKMGYVYDDNILNNDSVITNLPFEYEKYTEGSTWTFNLTNNTIDVTTIPSRFDLRDWGWVSAVKHQGHMGACWTFGTIGTLESVILKSYGIELDLSEANLFHNLLRYSIYGSTTSEGGGCLVGSSYLAGWYDLILEEDDPYDEVGKLLPYMTLTDYEIIHIQDVMFIPTNSQTNSSEIKLAIMKYGSVGGSYYAEYGTEGFYDPVRASQYTNESIDSNHAISIVGWDDHYSKDNFLITPPGDGAWIIKNSWGTQFGDNGFLYISYYDKTFLSETIIGDYAMAILTENAVSYNKNYQYDFVWGADFLELPDGIVTVKNVFNAAEDDLLAAVGTYFNGEGENYTVKIYVNDELKLVQDGISPFLGYHTIKLNEYVPIKKGDVFEVVITSNAIAYTDSDATRIRISENVSFLNYDGEWRDMGENGMTACIKAYTVEDDSKIINNKDISVDYDGGKYFSVNVVTDDGHAVLGAAVKFTINGKTTTVKSDANGIAKIKIDNVPKTYAIKTTYKKKKHTQTRLL